MKLCFLLFLSAALFGVERGWNSPELAKAYFHHSETQRGWAWELLGLVSFEGSEELLDFGCGDGKITAEMARLIPRGHVTGVDRSSNMIHLAKMHFPQSAYANLAFRQTTSETFEEIEGLYDVISAFSVFNFVSEPVKILQNLKAHLRPDGRLLLVVPFAPGSTMRQAANECFAKYNLEAPWHLPNYSSKLSMRTLAGCQEKLQEAGYEIVLLHKIDTPSIFHDLEDLIDWLIGTASANWGIPFEISRSFYTDVATKLVELDPSLVNEEGCILLPQPRICVIARPL